MDAVERVKNAVSKKDLAKKDNLYDDEDGLRQDVALANGMKHLFKGIDINFRVTTCRSLIVGPRSQGIYVQRRGSERRAYQNSCSEGEVRKVQCKVNLG